MAGNRKQLVRERMRFTGESYRVALDEIRQYGPLPAAATVAQEWLESHFVRDLGESGFYDPTGSDALNRPVVYEPGTVLGIRSVTPRPHELLLDVAPADLLAVVDSALPALEKEDDIVWGMPGLRPRLTERGLELFWPVSEARIVLRKVTEQQWLQTRDAVIKGEEAALQEEGTTFRGPWRDHPTSWTPKETETVSEHLIPEYSWLDSGVIRRALYFADVAPKFLNPYPSFGPSAIDESLDVLPVWTDGWGKFYSDEVHVPVSYGKDTVSPWPIQRCADHYTVTRTIRDNRDVRDLADSPWRCP